MQYIHISIKYCIHLGINHLKEVWW